jgi:hypothetical protein
MASSTISDEDDGSWTDVDFSRIDDPRDLRHFVGICDYLLDGGDSDDGGRDAGRQRLRMASTRHDQ